MRAYHGFAVCSHKITLIPESKRREISIRVKRTYPYRSDKRATTKCRQANVAMRSRESRAPSVYAEAKTHAIETVKIIHPEEFGFVFPRTIESTYFPSAKMANAEAVNARKVTIQTRFLCGW